MHQVHEYARDLGTLQCIEEHPTIRMDCESANNQYLDFWRVGYDDPLGALCDMELGLCPDAPVSQAEMLACRKTVEDNL